MLVDPCSGEIRDAALDRGVPIDLLMHDLSTFGDELVDALATEERAELAYDKAESIATIKNAHDVPATILNKYVGSLCDAERAAHKSARFARRRAELRYRTTESLLTAEEARLKHFGAADGGSR